MTRNFRYVLPAKLRGNTNSDIEPQTIVTARFAGIWDPDVSSVMPFFECIEQRGARY